MTNAQKQFSPEDKNSSARWLCTDFWDCALELYLCFQLDSLTLLKKAFKSYFQLGEISFIQRLQWINIHYEGTICLNHNTAIDKINDIYSSKYCLSDVTCFQYLKKIMYEHILHIHPFHTCAVVTEQITSPRCALIILLKALITSPVKVRRPLSAKTSKEGEKKKTIHVWARFSTFLSAQSKV